MKNQISETKFTLIVACALVISTAGYLVVKRFGKTAEKAEQAIETIEEGASDVLDVTKEKIEEIDSKKVIDSVDDKINDFDVKGLSDKLQGALKDDSDE